MGDIHGGRGYIDGNTTATSENVTYVDTAVPFNGNGTIYWIKFNAAGTGTKPFQVGVASIDGTTVTPKSYVELNVTGLGAGVHSFSAPSDFTAFEVSQNDVIMIWPSGGSCLLDRTTTGTPLGYGYLSGKQIDEETFVVSLSTTRAIEIIMSGTSASGEPISTYTSFKCPVGSQISWVWNSGQFNSDNGMRATSDASPNWEWGIVSSSVNYFYKAGTPTGWVWKSGSGI